MNEFFGENEEKYTFSETSDCGTDISPDARKQQSRIYDGPYGHTRDFTNEGQYMYTPQPAKKPVGTATKVYVGIIAALCVLFVVCLGVEWVHDSENALPMSEWNIGEFIDTDFDFGGDYDIYDDSDSESDDGAEASDTEADNRVNDIIDAPDSSNLINSNAEKIKVVDQPENIDSADYNARKAFKAVEKSVVGIVTYTGKVGIEEDAEGEGTGIIVTEDGYIVTNSHVISDTKDIGVEVITSDGQSYSAVVVGYDSRTDLALLKINASNLKPVEFVNSDQIEVGQDALAVGNPGGMNYSNSLTRGAVSALNRTVSSNSMVMYIQTDAAINPGNSGGPLLNIAGQVMGINTIKIADTDYEGMGFAIPSNTVIEIVNDLMTKGYVSGRVKLGIIGQAVSPYLAEIYDVPRGIMIDEISEGSVFENTDAKVDDIITGINGAEITTFNQLYSELEKYEPGQTVTISLYRINSSGSGGKNIEVDVTLTADLGETSN